MSSSPMDTLSMVDWLKGSSVTASRDRRSMSSAESKPLVQREIVTSPVAALGCDINSLRRKLLAGTDECSSGFQRQESIDEGCSLEQMVCSVDSSSDSTQDREIYEEMKDAQPVLLTLLFLFSDPRICQGSSTMKKYKSLPLTAYGFTLINSPRSMWKVDVAALPGAKEDESSQDSGIGFEKDDFKIPRLPLSALSKSQFSNLTLNATQRGQTRASLIRSFSSPATSCLAFGCHDGKVRQKSGLIQNENSDSFDDGFNDMPDSIDGCGRSGFDCREAAVLNEPFNKSDVAEMCNRKKRLRTTSTDSDAQSENLNSPRVTRRNLFCRPSAVLNRSESLNVGTSLKIERHEQSHRPKRLRSLDTDSPVVLPSRALDIAPVRRLVRCQSEAAIKLALTKSDGQCGDLIGDFSQSHCLPLALGRHQDLKAISPSTMASILNDEYAGCLPKSFIVDCRYPYEFCAGHVQGALNIFSKDAIIEQFFSTTALQSANSTVKRRPVIIFYCEFSSERGPKLMRFLRNTDRKCNTDCYPALHYPELYLLEGGYRDFFRVFNELCEPQGYKPMLHEGHADELKHFRSKMCS